MCASLLVDFAVIPSRCRKLSIQVTGKAGNVFEFALQGLCVLQETDETKRRIASLEAMEVKLSAKVPLLEDHERGLTYENCCFRRQLVVISVEDELGEARELADKKTCTDAKMELANMKEENCILKERASNDRSLMLSAVEDKGSVPEQLVTTSAKVQIAEGVINAAFYQLKKYSRTMRMATVAVTTWVKANLQNYVQKVFDHVKQSTETYQLNVEGGIASLTTVLFQDVRKICAKSFTVFMLCDNMSRGLVKDHLRNKRGVQISFR